MIKKAIVISAVVTSFIALTGCASIVNGTNQSVSVHTGNVGGATCSLQNSKGTWYVNNTPGSVVVNRSYSDLRINCEKKGFRPSYKQVASHTKAMAFGNLVFGGVVGAGVDVVDGAAYDYPTDVFVPMNTYA
jgi:uncharacterized protein YceK